MATFLKTTRVAGEDTVAVPCDTPSHNKVIPELNKMESTIASHIATHEQFPSVHRDQVADKPLRLCPCLMDATRCSRNVAEPTTLPLYWQPHRKTVETMSLSHGRHYSLQQARTLLARLVFGFGAKTVITQFLMNIQQLAINTVEFATLSK